MEEKICLECQTPLKGRADKRFCDDGCRNAYHNRTNSSSNNYVRRVNHQLRKNRRILASLLGNAKMIKTSREKLISLGFTFEYHTRQLQTSKGHTYLFCYEYGYLPLANDSFLIVKDQKLV